MYGVGGVAPTNVEHDVVGDAGQYNGVCVVKFRRFVQSFAVDDEIGIAAEDEDGRRGVRSARLRFGYRKRGVERLEIEHAKC